eukprot:9476729-Pyramimonas_sp.AAC.1
MRMCWRCLERNVCCHLSRLPRRMSSIRSSWGCLEGNVCRSRARQSLTPPLRGASPGALARPL